MERNVGWRVFLAYDHSTNSAISRRPAERIRAGKEESIFEGTLSIDVEEWFCAHNLSPPILRADWEHCESRVEVSTLRILDMLDRHRARATFFLLGWVMERVPDLAPEIAHRGHEVASHGYDHRKLTDMTPESFAADLDRTLEIHARQLSAPVRGYRAPSFTLMASSLWAVPVLESRGFQYSSSVFPVRGHPVYGMTGVPLTPWRIGETLTEIPLTVARIAGQHVPCAGGAYFRLLPYRLTRALLHRVRREGRMINMYMHPWEIDPGQPRQSVSVTRRLRHYTNLRRTEERLERLLSDFRLTSIKELPCLHNAKSTSSGTTGIAK